MPLLNMTQKITNADKDAHRGHSVTLPRGHQNHSFDEQDEFSKILKEKMQKRRW